MSFGLKYYAQASSRYNSITWRAEIAERNYTGAAEEINFAADDPIVCTWEASGDAFYEPVKGSQATIVVKCDERFKFAKLYTADPRQFRLSIYRKGNLYWRGYLVADTHSEPLAALPYEVTLSAIDGFSILKDSLYVDDTNSPYTDNQSLWSILDRCIAKLDLDMTLSEWIDLYTNSSVEYIPSLPQVYIDMKRVSVNYGTPSYRDMLELCLRPFTAQIFQAGGYLHVRRIMSLYNSYRPSSFYVSEIEVLPTSTASETSETSEEIQSRIAAAVTRPVYEPLWQDTHPLDSCILSKSPALKSIAINVEKTQLSNMLDVFDIYNIDSWQGDDTYQYLTFPNQYTLRLNRYDGFIYTDAIYVYKSAAEFKISCSLSYTSFLNNATRTAKFGLKLSYGSTTYYLNNSGEWVTQFDSITQLLTSYGEATEKSITFQSLPISGLLQLFIGSDGFATDSIWETISYNSISITMTEDDDSEDDVFFNSEYIVDPANNLEYEVSLPIADMYDIPNAAIIYSLYLIDSNQDPTYNWHQKGKSNHMSLVNHLRQAVLKLHSEPTNKLTGDMFATRHVDLNSVFTDSETLNSSFYVNSLETNAIEDTVNVELVELPNLLTSESTPDDCYLVFSTDLTINQVVPCANHLILWMSDNTIVAFNPISYTYRTLISAATIVSIHQSYNTFVVVKTNSIEVFDLNGNLIYKVSQSTNAVESATWINGKLYIVSNYEDNGNIYNEFYEHGQQYARTKVGLNSLILRTRNALTIGSIYIHDNRSEVNSDVRIPGAGMIAISDNYIVTSATSRITILLRTSSSTETVMNTISGSLASCAACSVDRVAYASTYITIWEASGTTTNVINMNETSLPTNLFYLYGTLFMVYENAIYKYLG